MLTTLILTTLLIETSVSILTDTSGFYSITSKKLYKGESSKICLQFQDIPANTNIETQINLNEIASYSWMRPEDSIDGNLFQLQITGTSDTVNSDFKNCYDVLIPSDVDTTKNYEMVMNVTVDGETLSAKNGVKISSSNPVIFLSTDKPVYKPGQTVKFRVLGLDRFLKPSSSDLKLEEVFIKNPSQAKLISIVDASFNNYGMWGDEFYVVAEAEVGDWELGVKINDEDFSTTFKVTEYVLPKFDIDITPRFFENSWFYLADSVDIDICAKYTHGAIVQGKVFVNFLWKADPWYWPEEERRSDVRIELENYLNEEGCQGFSVNSVDLYGNKEKFETVRKMNGFSIDVEVEEAGTGESITDNLSISDVTTNEIIVEVYDNFLQKPGMPEKIVEDMDYFVTLMVKNWNGSSIGFITDLYISVGSWNPDVNSFSKYETDSTGNLQINLKDLLNNSIKSTNLNIFINSDLPITENEYMQDKNLVNIFNLGDHWNNGYSLYRDSLQISLFNIQLIKNSDNENVLHVFRSNLNCDEKTIHSEMYAQFDSTTNVILKAKLISQGSVISDNQNPGGIILSELENPGMISVSFSLEFSQVPIGLEILYFIVLPETGMISASSSLTDESVECLKSLELLIPASAKPGEDINVEIRGVKSNTECSLSIVDDSVAIYSKSNGIKDNDIDLDYIKEVGVEPFKPSWDYSMNCYSINKRDIMPWSFFGEIESFRVFSSFNDVDCNGDRVYIMEDGVAYDYGVPEIAMAVPESTNEMTKIDPSSAEPEKSVTKVRNFMPETWLWTLSNTEESTSSKMTITTKTPDTITSWTANAYCISESNRLSLSNSPKITVSKKLFLEIKLPYSCVRNEILKVPIQIFNNDAISHSVDLRCLTDDKYLTLGENQRLEINVKSGQQIIEYFDVIATGIGETSLTCSIDSDSESDAMEQKIIVEPEGIFKEITNGNLLCLESENDSFELQSRPVIIDSVLVPGSLRNRITIVDDIMGSAMENLDRLIKIPYGCGEQNMVSVVPNIAVAKYLEDDNPHKSQAIKNAQHGYQRQLNYQRSDGSFSAFGESDDSGSSWLTSFVIRSFADASEFVTVDTDRLTSAITYLIERQNRRDGSFPIIGQVLHNELFDENKARESGNVYMTVSATLALIKAFDSWSIGIKSPVLEAIQYLVSKTSKFPNFDSYILAQLFYLGQIGTTSDNFVNNIEFAEIRNEAFKILESRKTIENGLTYWTAEDDSETKETRNWWYEPPSADVETTGYVFLGILDKNEELTGNEYSIMKYLQAQRNDYGGWSSTQNTMLALSALSQYAKKMNPGDSDLSINIDGLDELKIIKKKFKTVTVIDVNEIDDVIPNIWNVKISGTGCVLVQSTIKYNVKNISATENLVITYEPRTIEVLRKKRDLTASSNKIGEFCVQSKSLETNMGILEVKLVTGYSLKTDISVPKNLNAELKRVEIDNDKIEFYFDKFGKNKRCVTLEFTKDVEVEGVAPASVIAYDYYAPEKSSGKLTYLLSERSSSGETNGSKIIVSQISPWIFGAIGFWLTG